MKRFQVTVPLVVFWTYGVTAEDEDEAMEHTPAVLPGSVGGGGLGAPHGTSLATSSDNLQWELAEVSAVEARDPEAM